MTAQIQEILKYIPKKWRIIVLLIVVTIYPVSPFIINSLNDGLNSKIDNRMGKQIYYIEKTQDSICIVLQENRESFNNLNMGMSRLNDNILNLHKWLVENR